VATTTIIVPCPAAPPAAVVSALLGQDHARILFIGPGAPAALDGTQACSVRTAGSQATLAELINLGINEAATDHVQILHPSDSLDVAAPPWLIKAAGLPGVAGAIGGFRFTSPIGPLPQFLPSLPDTLGLEHLLHLRPIISAALINRRAIGDLRLRRDLPCGADLDFLLRLAEEGRRFAHAPAPVVNRPLHSLADFDTTLHDLAAHIRILADFIPPSELPTAAADLVDAVIVLRAHQRAMADRGPGSRHVAAMTRFPHLFAQWWHRCGLLGPAPRHVLDANGGTTEAVSSDPDIIAARLLSMCPRKKPPILLGLGRNARVIARALHAAGMPVIGRDDTGRPAWSSEDDIPVEVVPASTPFDPSATHIMTVLHDDAFLARLPRGLRIIRWRSTPDLILAEWRSAALDWALRMGLAEPKPALTGAPA
jgi:hypothetical protein